MSRRLLVVANDHVGTRMAGPAVRSWRFAQALATAFDVTLSVPYPTDLESDAFEIRVANPGSAREMTPLARGFDVVVTQRLPVPTAYAAARRDVRIIFDLYAPIVIENLAFDTLHEQSRIRELHYRLNSLELKTALATGAAFICASETQRDLYLGSLLATGRIDHATYEADRSLRSLIDVVPFGLDPEPPTHKRNVMRDVIPGIGADDRVLLWGGGIWNWFDPLTVIRAVHRLSRDRDDVRLVFLGTTHPNPRIAEMAMTRRAVDLADELGLRDRNVFFNSGWVPYDERGSYLLEADVGVAAHFEDLETRFAFRTRLIDYIWAGLPIVTTAGDSLSELVARRGIARAVGVGDADGYARALDSVLREANTRARLAPEFDAARKEFAWPRVLAPLISLAADGTRGRTAGAAGQIGGWAVARTEHAVRNRGMRGAARRAFEITVERRPKLR